MANSQGISHSERSRIRFKVLEALYAISNGYKYTFVTFDNLYRELQTKSDKENEVILEIFEELRNYGLVDSKALATASITHEGIKELENMRIGSGKGTNHFLSSVDASLTNEDEIKSIKDKRTSFLKKAYELSKGSLAQPVSAFKIMDILGYDKKTLERIYFYLEDEGLIKTFALGGEFTITQKGIEQ